MQAVVTWHGLRYPSGSRSRRGCSKVTMRLMQESGPLKWTRLSILLPVTSLHFTGMTHFFGGLETDLHAI